MNHHIRAKPTDPVPDKIDLGLSAYWPKRGSGSGDGAYAGVEYTPVPTILDKFRNTCCFQHQHDLCLGCCNHVEGRHDLL